MERGGMTDISFKLKFEENKLIFVGDLCSKNPEKKYKIRLSLKEGYMEATDCQSSKTVVVSTKDSDKDNAMYKLMILIGSGIINWYHRIKDGESVSGEFATL